MPSNPDEIYWDIELAVGAAVLALDIPGIGDHVYSQLFPNEDSGFNHRTGDTQDLKFPAVLLTSEGETDEVRGGDSESTIGVYPLRCWVADRVNPGMHAKKKVYVTARRMLIRKFNQQRLASRPEVIQCTTHLNILADPRLPMYQFLVSGIVIKAEFALPRY